MISILQRGTRQPWLWIVVILGIAGGLRFWQLGRFNALVFDEVYFVTYAQSYRQGFAPTDAHPPFGKYIIALSIQVGSWLTNSWPNNSTQTVAEIGLSPIGYRQANALAGSLVPLVVMGIARTLSRLNSGYKKVSSQWPFAILCGLFVAIDGLFVTESRYALLNIHVVLLGLLSHWLWLRAVLAGQNQPQHRYQKRLLLRAASGIFLGMAIAVKWNGLGYLLSLVIWETWRVSQNKSGTVFLKSSLINLVFLVLTAIATYSLIWWPHLHITRESIFSVHANLFSFHQQLGASGHTACSKWYSWPLLIRPITYWYSKPTSLAYTVSNLGNPVLWLLSSSTVFILAVRCLLQTKRDLSFRLNPRINPLKIANSSDPVTSYLLIGYFCNWLPWMLVQRCTFNYLYMPAAVFGFMSLAWLLSTWLRSPQKTNRFAAWLMLSLIAIAFIFWLPLALGLPLSPKSLQMRWLLKSWI